MLSMKIFGYFHFFPPVHMAGSETTVLAAFREMVQRGHEVLVLADQTPESYKVDGIQVLAPPKVPYIHDWVKEQAKDFDVIVTHLDCTSRAMNLSIDLSLPLVHFVHNSMQLRFHGATPNKAQLVIFNSRWVRDAEIYKEQLWPGPIPTQGWEPVAPKSIVVHPIVEPENYHCERGTKITLCNPTDGKGISTLHKLSEAMPDFEFLVVAGVYGEQISPPNLGTEWERAHPNVEHMENSPDFRDVLRKTKVLLMPSNYESYGRCAVEAACAGIPSIVHPTEGLLESLGAERKPTAEELKGGWVSGAGVFCDRADVPSWKSQIERLYSDEVYYRSRSDAALRLANSLDPRGEFDRLEQALLQTVEDWRKKEEIMIPKMWTSDRRVWETTDGRLVPEVGGRIPQDAVRLAAGIGTEITEEAAIANGLIPSPEVKAVEAPQENKAIEAPQENKAQGRRKKIA